MALLQEEPGPVAGGKILWIATVPLLFILLVNPRPSWGQSNWCEVMNFVVSTTDFQEFIKDVPCDSSIVLFDTESVDAICSIPPLGCHVFEVRHDTIYNKLSPNRYDPTVSRYLLVVYGYRKKGNNICLRFWRPLNNRTIAFNLKTRGKRFFIKTVGQGVF